MKRNAGWTSGSDLFELPTYAADSGLSNCEMHPPFIFQKDSSGAEIDSS